MPPVPGISLTLNSVAGRDGHAPRPGVAAAKHNQIVAGHGRAEVPGEAGPALAPATMLLITGGSAPAIAQGYRRDPDRRSCQLRAGVSWHSYSSWGRQIVLIRGETSASRGPLEDRAARRAHCAPHHLVAGSDRPFTWDSLGGYMTLLRGSGRARTREMAKGGGNRTLRSDPVAAARYQRRSALLVEGFLPPPRHSVWRTVE
jgi:hypothetical protein